MRRPPPLLAIVGLELWLKYDRVVLNAAVPAVANVDRRRRRHLCSDCRKPSCSSTGSSRKPVADADTACPRRSRREQFVAGGRVQRDIVMVHVDVQVKTRTVEFGQ